MTEKNNGQESKPQGNQPKNRPKRTPLGQRGRLTYDPQLLAKLKAQGLVPRLITDSPGRIQAALEAGYRFVQADGQIGEERVGNPEKMGANMTSHVGSGATGYLMAIPKEFYDEDQAAKQNQVTESEKAMKRPPKKLSFEGKQGDGTTYGPGLTDE